MEPCLVSFRFFWKGGGCGHGAAGWDQRDGADPERRPRRQQQHAGVAVQGQLLGERGLGGTRLERGGSQGSQLGVGVTIPCSELAPWSWGGFAEGSEHPPGWCCPSTRVPTACPV